MTDINNDIKKYLSENKFPNNEKTKLQTYENALKLTPNDPNIYNNLGIFFIQLGRFLAAIKCFKKAIYINPNFETAHNNLGNAFQELGKYQEAVSCYKKALHLQPANSEIHYNLGKVLQKLSKYQEAISCYQEAIQINPNYIKAHNNLGNAFQELGRYQESIKCFKKAIYINPNFETAHNNLGNAFQELGKYQEAVSCYKKALHLQPANSEIHYNLGCVLDEVGRTRDAILSYSQAIKHDSTHSSAHYNLARAQLAIDDFKNGWTGYERREGGTQKFYEKLGISKERVWDGGKFDGPLIIHAEQGVGDEILYSSMFLDLFDYHKNLIISADKRLVGIFQRSFPKIKFISKKESIDMSKNPKHLLGISLGRYFRTSLDDFKKDNKPWLVPNMRKVEEFKKFFSSSDKIRVGLCWKSSGIYNSKRNILLTDLVKIFPKDNFEIINLQYGDIQTDTKILEDKEGRKLIYFDHLDYTKDLESLAGLICNCDLVVSIGGFTASFASVLGKQTWVIVPAVTDWVWHSHSNRTSSLWFPNIKIFRQKTTNEWKYVFENIKAEVSAKYIKK